MLKLNPRIKNSSEFQAGTGAASHMFCLLVLRENQLISQDISLRLQQFLALQFVILHTLK